ncbi:hypothetical protein C7M84_011279 [Penaeus vannamei]|uniref:inositol-1,4-bisphosphate 1-phosphatase n=1 Tax=Penaeus vannamei TaxID=6689 RepID=A0A3R7M2Z0_PENVA|nr:hypothetical protein C7M84_011279 [Penaeus vannamei]
MELIETLLSFSEKAGEIARTIRREPKLFSLLVEEKGEEEKNQRFTQDFKTLADVLIQEALRHHVTQMIPSLGEHVHGEESAEFTNTLGERVIVQICATKEETATLLEKVLDGNREAADLLAAVVHTAIIVKPDSTLAAKIPKIPLDNLGIWIDPIDSTGEYVRGEIGKLSGSIYSSGLPSVTILIGFYDRFTGEIIGGVVNHPFAVYDEENQSWHGEVYWSVNYNDVKVHNMQIHKLASDATRPVIVMSSSEDVKVQEMLGKKFDIVYASGAGYKLLVVALGQVVAYVCSKSSTFRWDTAAPHGLLQALGGGVVVYRQLLSSAEDNHVSEDMLKNIQIKYNKPNADSPKASLQWSNAGGIVAYRDNKEKPRERSSSKPLLTLCETLARRAGKERPLGGFTNTSLVLLTPPRVWAIDNDRRRNMHHVFQMRLESPAGSQVWAGHFREASPRDHGEFPLPLCSKETKGGIRVKLKGLGDVSILRKDLERPFGPVSIDIPLADNG